MAFSNHEVVLLLNLHSSYHNGQMCVAGSRIFVQEGIYDRFIHAFSAVAQSFKLGDGFDPNCNQGPLISEGQLKVSVLLFFKGRIAVQLWLSSASYGIH